MMAENSWGRFTRLFSEDPESMKESPAYNLIVPEYGIPLMAKLVATALIGPSRAARNHAAIVIQEMTETDLLKNAYLHLHLLTLDLFRRCAIHLMVSNEVGSDLQDCGLLLTVDLVSSSLQHNDIDGWNQLIELTEQGFSTQPENLDLILDVFCELRVQHMPKFVSFLEPCIMANSDQFITRLLNLLRQGDDCRAYMILPSLYRLLCERTWKRLMGGAIMSPFFLKESHSSKRVCGAEYLKISVEMSLFSFSPAWVPYARGIIDVLFIKSRDARETSVAHGLWSAFTSKRISRNYY